MFEMMNKAFNKAKNSVNDAYESVTRNAGKVAAAFMGALGLGMVPTDGHALAVTDFDTGSAATDIGLAVVAVLGIVIVGAR